MDTEKNTDTQVLNVPIEDIIPNRFQPRLNFDENSLKELASSIKEHGIIQPLVLRRLNDKYEIIAGERRYKAAKLAGLTSVPAILSDLDDNASAEVAIVENVQRKDLTSIEEAKSYKTLLDKGYLTQEELAKKMGLSQSAISNKLRLLSLSDEVQKAIMEGKISERHARSLLQLEDEDDQNSWLKRIIEERLTVRDLDQKLKELNKKETKEDDVPIIESTPSISDIKEKATDIVFSKPVENKEEAKTEEKKTNVIPNKFFNFLEDEQANMNVTEATDGEKEEIAEAMNVNPIIDSKAPVVNVEPVVDSVVEPVASGEEEIEMLDFEVPAQEQESKEVDTKVEEQKEFSLDKAYELISKLEDDLRNNNYKISLSRENDEKEVRYTITISKE